MGILSWTIGILSWTMGGRTGIFIGFFVVTLKIWFKVVGMYSTTNGLKTSGLLRETPLEEGKGNLDGTSDGTFEGKYE